MFTDMTTTAKLVVFFLLISVSCLHGLQLFRSAELVHRIPDKWFVRGTGCGVANHKAVRIDRQVWHKLDLTSLECVLIEGSDLVQEYLNARYGSSCPHAVTLVCHCEEKTQHTCV